MHRNPRRRGGGSPVHFDRLLVWMAFVGFGSAAACAAAPPASRAVEASPGWVGTWAAAPQLTEPGNLPPAPGLTGSTLRQVVFVSIGGSRIRVRFSNAYGDGPLAMTSVHVAVSKGAGAIDASTDTALQFSGKPSVTLAAGDSVWSDPTSFALAPLTSVAVTIAFADTPAAVTGHPGSRTTSYLQAGNTAGAASMPSAAATPHWYCLTGVDVPRDAAAGAIVVLGDSLTDGRGSTTDGNNRWPDDLSRRLQAGGAGPPVSVLNVGIGGNAVLSGGLGPPAVRRFASDVLGQSGARWLIVIEGVNDLGGAIDDAVVQRLVAAFGRFIDQAHAKGLRAFGVPILPFGGSMYDSAAHQAARQSVNTWVRTSGRFDAVFDLDAVVRDPANPNRLLPSLDSGDHLHLNPAGYQAMADAIDLSRFRPAPSDAR
ncbi:MAG TPA: SGNH/GDSL hydrolase family protein [Polyangiaceae bacterium]